MFFFSPNVHLDNADNCEKPGVCSIDDQRKNNPAQGFPKIIRTTDVVKTEFVRYASRRRFRFSEFFEHEMS